MSRYSSYAVAAFLVTTSVLAAGNPPPSWPQWRGPLGTGEAPQADPPAEWSSTRNVKWRTEIPGFGTSTPVIWGDQIFVLTAIPTGEKQTAVHGVTNLDSAKLPEVHTFDVLSIHRSTGKVQWQKTVRREAPHEGHHQDHGFASASPVTDGEVLIVYFGSRGLHCLDLQGNVKWSKDLGRMFTRNRFGEGASPALSGNTVVVVQDDETKNDFIAGFDKISGKELWRTPRQEETGWSTPLIVHYNGTTQAVVNAAGKVRSYNLENGNEIWSCGGQTANAIPTPVAAKDVVYVTSGFRGSALYALALGRTGDLENTDAILWKRGKNTPYVPSPLLVNNLLYLVTGNNGVLTCLDSVTGSSHFEGERLEGISGIYTSPVAARDRVYVLGRNGVCLVLKQGPKLEVISRNDIGEKTDASLALVGNEVFLRSHKALYCIGPSN